MNIFRKTIKIKYKPVFIAIIVFILGMYFLSANIYVINRRQVSLEENNLSNALFAFKQYKNNISLTKLGTCQSTITAGIAYEELKKDEFVKKVIVRDSSDYKKWLNTPLVTSNISLNKDGFSKSDWDQFNKDVDSGTIPGIIKIKRSINNQDSEVMNQVSETTLDSYIAEYLSTGSKEARDKAISNYAVRKINNSLHIVYVRYEEHNIILKTNDPNYTKSGNTIEKSSPDESSRSMNKIYFDFQNITKKYEMPFDFLYKVAILGRNPQCVNELSNLAYQSTIDFQIAYTPIDEEKQISYSSRKEGRKNYFVEKKDKISKCECSAGISELKTWMGNYNGKLVFDKEKGKYVFNDSKGFEVDFDKVLEIISKYPDVVGNFNSLDYENMYEIFFNFKGSTTTPEYKGFLDLLLKKHFDKDIDSKDIEKINKELKPDKIKQLISNPIDMIDIENINFNEWAAKWGTEVKDKSFQGEVVKYNLTTDEADNPNIPIEFEVYLPSVKLLNGKIPKIVYLMHEQGGDVSDIFNYSKMGGINGKNVLDNLNASGTIEPIVVVSVEIGRFSNTDDLGINYSNVIIPKTEQFIKEQLNLPEITEIGRDDRTIGGFGLGAVNTYNALPGSSDLCKNYIIVSGKNETIYDEKQLEDIANNSVNVYCGYGKLENNEYQENYKNSYYEMEQLNKNGNNEYIVIEGAGHHYSNSWLITAYAMQQEYPNMQMEDY